MRSLQGLVAGLVLLGCDLEPEAACPQGAACCPAWTRLEGDQCVPLRWRAAATLGTSASKPEVSVSPDGDIAVAWLDVAELEPRLGVAAERDDFAEVIAESGGSASEPKVAAGRAGRVDVVWREELGETRAIRHGMRGAGGWLWREEPLSFDPDAAEPDIVAGASGEVILAWNQWMGDNWGVAVAQAAGAEPFERPGHVYDVLSPALNHSNYPEIAVNSDGEALITWFQAAAGLLDAYVSERRAGTRHFTHPGPGAAVSPGGGDVESPVVALSEGGMAAVAWDQTTIDGARAVFVAIRDPSGTWTTPASLDDSLSRPLPLVQDVRIAFAGEDLYVVWQQEDESGDSAVFLAHRAADGTWVAPGRSPFRLSATGVRGFDPALAGGARGVVASWTERRDDELSVVTRRSAADALGAEEADRWGGSTVLSLETAGGSMLSIGGGDRAACVWDESGRIQLAVID